MKKGIIYLLCCLLFFQNSTIAYATETLDTEINIVQEQDILLKNDDLVEEELLQQDIQENIVEGIQENDDPQYGRANGYLDEEFFGLQLYSEEYIHAEKYKDYIIKDVIDVSNYQGEIDWGEVKDSGIDYAFIRAGFRGYGETGSLNKDDCFEKNVENAIKSGIDVGVYFFSQAITEEEAFEEAETVLEWVTEFDITLPIVFDYEYATTSDGLTGRLYNANLSKEEATNICKMFCSTIEHNGYVSMVYANKNMLENGLNASEIENTYKIWLANYSTYTNYEGKYDFWQYTNSGTVNGISGKIDKSFWYIEPEVKYAEISENLYRISTLPDPNKVLDVPGASVENGVNIQIYESNGTWAQKFYIRQENEDTYVIMSANSGKVLEFREDNVCQSDYTGENNQQWRFLVNADGSYSVESVSSGKVMSLDGTKIQVQKANQEKAQRFILIAEAEESSRSVEDGIYYVETLLCEDKVWDTDQEAKTLKISTITGESKQKIQVEYIENGCYQMRFLTTQELLLSGDDSDIFWGNSSEEVLSSGWIFKTLSNGTINIISVKDGKNLDVRYGSTADGTIIQKYSGNGTKAQQFKLYKTKANEDIEEGIYVIHSALSDSYVIDVSGASKSCGANVQLYQKNGTAAQKFVVKKAADGTYNIYSYNSGMALSVQDSKSSNMANVMQFFHVNAIGQKWNIVSIGKNYHNIISCVGESALDVANASVKNSANIQIYQRNGTKAQKFRFEKVGEADDFASASKRLENGSYTIYSALDETKVVDVQWGSLYAGANVNLYSSNGTSAQKFVIQKDADTDFYKIVSKKSGLNICYQDGILKNSTNVFQNGTIDKVGERWRIEHVLDDYYMVFAADSKFCLDISGGGTSDGTNVQIYESNGTKAQIFKIIKESDQTKTEQTPQFELEEGIYTIATLLDSSKVLDIDSASTKDGANVQLYQRNQTNAQKYLVKRLDNGKYTLSALCSDKLLTVNGTNVCQFADQDSLNQQWEVIPAGNDYYTLRCAGNGKVLDVTYANPVNYANIQVYTPNYTDAQRFKFIKTSTVAKAEFGSNDDGYVLKYDAYVKGNEVSTDDNYYLMMADFNDGKIYGTPLGEIKKTYDASIRVNISDRNKLREIAMNQVVLAVKQSSSSYKAINEPVAISNLEIIAENKTPIFKGTSKKGLQGVAYASDSNNPQPLDARYTNTKQTLINLDLSTIVSKSPKSGYAAYSYKGNTYYFSELEDLQANIRSLNYGYKQYLYGNSGRTPVAVTLCLLLGYNEENSFLIDPAARKAGYTYYTLNVREGYARDTLEALFFYLGEMFGKSDCYVTNWILGNEINSSKAWNYSGGLSFDTYMNCYVTAFRMLYTGVKTEKIGNTVSISLDNGWIDAPDTYSGKATLDAFAQKIYEQNPDIDWSIAYHPYSYPLARADFWNDYCNTTDSLNTPYISMRNITVLTNYVSKLESNYNKNVGSIRVLLTEQGYSHSAGAEVQAEAIVRGYYIAEFNDRIDAFIIRAVSDDRDEMSGKLYFGLMNSQQDKRIALYAYEHMDSDLSKFAGISAEGYVTWENYSKFNKAKEIVCGKNWQSMIPGFNLNKLKNIK